jgi:redox-sensitive bicupin YhaK (pirin superfamily)
MAHVIEDVAHSGVAVPGMTARLVELEPGGQLALSGSGETMAYVVEGRGVTTQGALAPESVVWLDPGEALAIEAGAGGLRLLVAQTR